ncbi:MAG: DUF479 domain-containing protein [Aphanothece sp. CMT-3BRIN-NPC111]|jgi:acyl carrier protein phosphodiesterase|nr:DUF479 domain-containing protein [Aphanothece sp. CMT-3BRIN-NPC111]
MNYLAHLYLAEDSSDSLLGNFIADFVKGSAINRYSDEIRKGIELHRKVDAFTDSHPLFKESKKLMSDEHKRYAGITVDIFYDHFLAKNWSKYSTITLKEFTSKVYDVLEINADILPKNLQIGLPKIKLENWLMCYETIQGINLTLKRVSLRLKRNNNLAAATEDLKANYQKLEYYFKLFFPDLIKYVQSIKLFK